MPSLRNAKWSRREVLKQSGILSALGAASAASPLTAGAAALADKPLPGHSLTHEHNLQDNLFTRIGVRPMINGRGTFTIISGSCSLPEVKQAMYDASFYFVHLDEMMNGIGAQLGATDRRRVGYRDDRLRGGHLSGHRRLHRRH